MEMVKIQLSKCLIFQVTDLIMVTLQEVMHTSYEWLEMAEILATASGCLMVTLSLLIFSANCVSIYHNNTNATPQLVFIIIIYPALFIWGLFLALSIGATFVAAILDGVCGNDNIAAIWQNWDSNDGNTVCATIWEGEKCINCIDLYPFHFVFPQVARKEDMWICGREIYLFCDEDLPTIVSRWIMCLIGSLMTFLGIGLHLFDLCYLRTEIMEETNWKMKRELQYIRTHVKSALYYGSRVNSADVGLMFLNQTKEQQ
jgi:hypothetical protein